MKENVKLTGEVAEMRKKLAEIATELMAYKLRYGPLAPLEEHPTLPEQYHTLSEDQHTPLDPSSTHPQSSDARGSETPVISTTQASDSTLKQVVTRPLSNNEDTPPTDRNTIVSMNTPDFNAAFVKLRHAMTPAAQPYLQ